MYVFIFINPYNTSHNVTYVKYYRDFEWIASILLKIISSHIEYTAANRINNNSNRVLKFWIKAI